MQVHVMHARSLARILATTALTGALALPAAAQDDAFDLGTLVLSGGLTPIPEAAFGRAATVLTEDEIAASGARYVSDILRTVPGVSVSRTGGAGGQTQIRLRGHESNHVVVLIDGVEVAAPDVGEYDLASLLTADIARIEVLRGPQSALYGSNAIGGVVSITTRGATAPGFSAEVSAEYGTYNSVNGLLALRQGF